MRAATTLFLLFFLTTSAFSRPVSYVGGVTSITKHDAKETSSLIHYTIDAKTSVGLRNAFRDELRTTIHTLEVNRILHRDNGEDHQANFYLRGGFGIADIYQHDAPRNSVPITYVGVSTDWENRKFFASYENKFEHNPHQGSTFDQSARVGFAPYVAEFGELHTWLMLEVNHHPDDPDGALTYRPLVRFFKGRHLLELGMNDRKEAMANWIARF